MLIVADPPESGWVEILDNAHATAAVEMLAAPPHEQGTDMPEPRAPFCDCEQACDECVKEATRYG